MTSSCGRYNSKAPPCYCISSETPASPNLQPEFARQSFVVSLICLWQCYSHNALSLPPIVTRHPGPVPPTQQSTNSQLDTGWILTHIQLWSAFYISCVWSTRCNLLVSYVPAHLPHFLVRSSAQETTAPAWTMAIAADLTVGGGLFMVGPKEML